MNIYKNPIKNKYNNCGNENTVKANPKDLVKTNLIKFLWNTPEAKCIFKYTRH